MKVIVNDSIFNLTNVTQEIAQEEIIPIPGTTNGVNALGLVVFSMCLGLIIGNMKEEGQALRDFFDSLNEAIMRLVAIVMWWVLSCVNHISMACIVLNYYHYILVVMYIK